MPDSEQGEIETGSPGGRYRVGVLLYFRSDQGEVLLIRRARRPNMGLWCAVGGKLEMASGESPFECAIREAQEEVGAVLEEDNLALRCMLSERSYEGTGHWLMFLFEVRPRLASLPPPIDEGVFEFFEVDALKELDMPLLDRKILLECILNPDASEYCVIHAPKGTEIEPSLLVWEQKTGDRVGMQE